MKLSLRIVLLFCLTLLFNTEIIAASYNATSVVPPVENSSKSNTFGQKTKRFLQKHIVKRIKNRVQKVKDVWKTYKTEKNKKGVGLGVFFLLLTAVFVTLQLTGVIAWSWLWVLAPLWIPIAMFILLFLVVLVGLSAARK